MRDVRDGRTPEPGCSVVHELLVQQFPKWSRLPLRPLHSSGTDHIVFRLGDDLSVRLPRTAAAADQLAKEVCWLPKLAPHLPLATPIPLGEGRPSERFPYAWSVCKWIEGADALAQPPDEPAESAAALVRFLCALQALDTSGAPPPGAHNFHRGVPLAARDRMTRSALDQLQQVGEAIDHHVALEAWEISIAAPAWTAAPVWIHGDLHPGNLLVANGKLCGVIDFGALAVGDPACDLMAAWTVFDATSRPGLHEALALDRPTWLRARGWALSFAGVALAHYRTSNSVLNAVARRTIGEVLGDMRKEVAQP